MAATFDREPYEDARQAFEREYVRRLSERCGGDTGAMTERSGLPLEAIEAGLREGPPSEA